ncbi:hypothetical protein E7T06_09535 [Deinococcus sp. Arct2-2]|uniref:hypothetical protein n=1 Tax=Deinococcus sp. Arct2-2 TaxID=2568653 RepID=UPI0010A38CE6|nr:hypothetical protein [Deinococcus sp. Arct2-2]THF69987.1 hypothetical protein E7T06_09535 [Deinococcus sp. Arct2-2]
MTTAKAAPAAKAVRETDPRAAQHGQLIQRRRLELGLNRPAFVAQMEKHGQQITPDYLNKLERGTAALSRASLEVREAVRAVLGYSPEQWQASTGLFTPTAVATAPAQAFSAAARGYRSVPKPLPEPLPEALQEAVRLYSGQPEFAALAEPRWPRYLHRLHHKHRPTTPDGWLALFLRYRHEFDPPETAAEAE